MTHRCRDCPDKRFFSLKTPTIMEYSKIGYQKWTDLPVTSLTGVSSMKLHCDLGITQKSAWHLAHRLREVYGKSGGLFASPVEVDETYMDGKEKNIHADKKLKAGCGTIGKTAVVGARDRATGQVGTAVVEATNPPTLQGFVADRVAEDATVYTDENRACRGFPSKPEPVNHSAGEYVNLMVHTNGCRIVLVDAQTGIPRYPPPHEQKALGVLRRGVRGTPQSSGVQIPATMMKVMARGMGNKRLRHQDLIADWEPTPSAPPYTLGGIPMPKSPTSLSEPPGLWSRLSPSATSLLEPN